MSYVKVHMPTIVRVAKVTEDGNQPQYYSLSSGQTINPFTKKGELKKNYSLEVMTSQDVVAAVEASKARAKTVGKERSAKAVEIYRRNITSKAAPYLATKTKKGEDYKRGYYGVGSGKDSMLSAVNRTVARALGIPLNRQNREMINQIYADEVNSVLSSGIIAQEFEDQDFVKQKIPYDVSRYSNIPKAFGKRAIKDPAAWQRRMMAGKEGRKREYDIMSKVKLPGLENPWVKGAQFY